MINEIKINNFKSIKSKELSFGKVNIFVGANGAGKSNFLEAIGLASACFSKGIGETELARKGIRQSPPDLMLSAHKYMSDPDGIDIKVKLNDSLYYDASIGIDENDKSLRFLREECLSNDKKQFFRENDTSFSLGKRLPRPADSNRGMWDQVKATTAFKKEIINEIDEFSNYRIYSPQSDYLRGIKSSSIYDGPIGLHGEGLTESISDLISDFNIKYSVEQKLDTVNKYYELIRKSLSMVFIPGWTESVKVGEIEANLVSKAIIDKSKNILYFVDKYMSESRNTLSAYDSSEGTLFLLFMSAILCHKNLPRIFSIDNIDNGLNPLITRKLISNIIKITKEVDEENLEFGAKQIFMTSHNPTSIDAFDLFDKSVRVFVVYRDNMGLSQCDRLEPSIGMTKNDWAEKMGGKTLSQLWVEGIIPNINGREF